MSAGEVEKDKPVANIATHNIIIISGNFSTSTCDSKQGLGNLCIAPTKKPLVLRAELRLQNKAGMLLTPQVGYERE